MTDTERDELLIRIDERVDQLREEWKHHRECHEEEDRENLLGKLRSRVVRLEVLASLGIMAAGGVGAAFG